MKATRLLAVLLASLTLCTPLTGCGKDPAASTDTTAAPVSAETTAPAETEPAETEYPAPQIDAVDYSGKTLGVLANEPRAEFNYSEIYYADNTGDVINDAIFKRNNQIIEKYGVEIKTTDVSTGSGLKTFNNAILADTNEFHFASIRINDIMSSAASGYLMNIADCPYIDPAAPWYYQNMRESLSIGGQNYMLAGYLNMRVFDSVGTVFYNKDVAEKFGITNLNQLVFDGKWTLETFAELCAKVGNDINNDGKIDETDEVGMTSHPGGILNFFVGAGGAFVSKDSEDIPQYIGIDDKNADILDKVLNVLYDEPGSLHQIHSAYANYSGAFNEDRALFHNNCLYEMISLAAVSPDFGVLPPPKYNEAQESYYVHTHSKLGTAIGIPNNNKDLDMTCAILEDMMYWSYKYIYPAHIEKTMQIRYASDAESSDILKLMFNSICIEMSTALNLKCDNNLRSLGNVHSKDVVSTFLTTAEKDKGTLETYVNAFTGNKK
ncbi:MAG: hypothetical protein IJC15_04085 [Clostridia bacterium]|nr:hypothetical protein [Clostridia bacterium]